jgi:hypothetical protein
MFSSPTPTLLLFCCMLAPPKAWAASSVEKLQEFGLDQVQVTDAYYPKLFSKDVTYRMTTLNIDRLLARQRHGDHFLAYFTCGKTAVAFRHFSALGIRNCHGPSSTAMSEQPASQKINDISVSRCRERARCARLECWEIAGRGRSVGRSMDIER